MFLVKVEWSDIFLTLDKKIIFIVPLKISLNLPFSKGETWKGINEGDVLGLLQQHRQYYQGRRGW
jgi:hypothetical protein